MSERHVNATKKVYNEQGFEESDNLSQIHFNSAFFTDSGTYFGFASASEWNAYVTLYEDEERKYICYRFSLDDKSRKQS